MAGPDPRILILGSMPSETSLKHHQYYAHPRNTFWPVMGALLGFDPEQPYRQRLEALKAGHVALWDVVHQCKRPGSLDSNIERESMEPNGFPAFFAGHPDIRAIFFNGGTAEVLFQRYVMPALSGPVRKLPMHRLPSTSPAHAALSFDQKFMHWQVIRSYLPAVC